MVSNKYKNSLPPVSRQELSRRKREGILIVVIILLVALLTLVENQTVHFGVDLPVSSTILMFILININLLLLILLIFLVFRNLVKLFYDRKRKATGAKLRTRLVAAFIALTLMPTIVLFFFSISFITKSIGFWFNVPVEQALENSLQLGRNYYRQIEENNQFFLKRISYQIKERNLLSPENKKDFVNYIRVAQRVCNLHAVEVYDTNSNRIIAAIAPVLKDPGFKEVSADNLQKMIESRKGGSFTKRISPGELVRTVGTVPYGVNREKAKGYVVLTHLISTDVADNMTSISKGVEQYRQMKLLKRPIQIVCYIALSVVALLVVFCAVWFGFYLAKSITIPIMEIVEGTKKVAEGDLSFSITLRADDEIGSLVDSFNKMTRDLRIGREQLEYSAKKLREQNLEIEKRRQYMEIVLKNISAGVVTIGSTGLVTTINKAAEKMLSLGSEEIINKSFDNLLKERAPDFSAKIAEKLAGAQDDDVKLPLRLTIDGVLKSFIVHVNAFKDETGRHMGIVMVFDDLTDMEKAQRMVAWREVARRIAHEVKNPLTPISLSAQRLKRKYAEKINEPVFEECTKMIIDHVEMIRNMVNEFSAFAKFPAANPSPCKLQPIIEETVALYKEGHQDINFEISIIDKIPPLHLDRQQIKQAMINLVDNAVAAVKKKGEIIITVSYDPILNMVRIEVADNGTGISDEDKTRLFEPNFSTKKSGMGLGLTIVSAIVSDHNGMIRVLDNQPQGAKFVIELPVP